MDHSQFMNIRNYGYYRVAAFNFPVSVGNPQANREKMEKTTFLLAEKQVDYAVAPELSLTGYSCGDLFFQHTLLEEAAEEFCIMVNNVPVGILVTIGMPIAFRDKIFNCAVTFVNGKILGITPKSYLPTYREFYEKRHFASAEDLPKRSVVNFRGRKDVPFGADLIFCHQNGAEIHTSICEDDWMPIPYSRKAALNGANILANCSASPITIGKNEYRRDLMAMQSGSCLAAQIYTSAVGESTSDLSWDGQLIIAERGSIVAEVKGDDLFHKGTFIIADINITALITDRTMQSTFRDNARHNNEDFRFIEFDTDYDGIRHFYAKVDAHPFVPRDLATLDARCRQTFNIQAHALIKRLEVLSKSMQKVLLGLSGGSDSTLALLVAVHAFDKLGLDRKGIICLTMPGFGTTKGTKNNAVALAKAFGVTLKTIPIKKSCELRFGEIGYDVVKAFAANQTLTFENVQAWQRTDILFALAGLKGGIVLGTGDMSEAALGWCTYKGDHMSHYGINCGVPKTLVIHLIRWAAINVYGKEAEVREVLVAIVTTPISPELLPHKKGKIVQKSEEKIGPYELHDFFLYWFVRFGFYPAHIARLALNAFNGKYDIGTIKKWLRVFLTRFFQNQFKRNCVPDGPKVGLVALSPRGDWRMPSDADASAWMRNWELIPEKFD